MVVLILYLNCIPGWSMEEFMYVEHTIEKLLIN